MNDETFPDVQWGRLPPPLLRKPLEAFTASRFGSWCIRKLRPLDRLVLRLTNARYTLFGPLGLPLLLLTTTGRVSGQRRQTPLIYMREGNRLVIIGTNFGQAMDPAWSRNLLADPNAWITLGEKDIPVLATQLTGAEHDHVCTMFADYNPKVFQSYRHRTDRELRAFALNRR